jgi:hypothetical protein
MKSYQCPVCGYDKLTRPPENHEICPSCGTEFGYDDVGLSYRELREEWLRDGAVWFSPVRLPPPGWNPFDQLIRAGLAGEFFEVVLAGERFYVDTNVVDAEIVIELEQTQHTISALAQPQMQIQAA